MTSSQAQSRSEQIEAEISHLQRLVDLNSTDPQLLSMKWFKNVDIDTDYRVELDLFTESYVEVGNGKIQRSNHHQIHIDFQPSYPNNPNHIVRIASARLFHPNVPQDGIWPSRDKLQDIVSKLWKIFTFQYLDRQLPIRPKVLVWLDNNHIPLPLNNSSLRQPIEDSRMADNGFIVKRRVPSSGAEKADPPADTQQHNYVSPGIVVDEENGEKPPLNNLVPRQGTMNPTDGSQTNSSQQDVQRDTGSPTQPASTSASSVNGSGFRNKGIRIYQPQPWNFPNESWEHGEKKSYPNGWSYSVPRDYKHSNLKVVFIEGVVEKIFSHATARRDIERFGILVGGVFYDPQSDENWIEIVDMLPAERVRANVASVEVSNEEISYLNTKVDKILALTNQTVRKVGWYHTHPGHGIFMSSTDKTNQKLCYTADWQIALVVDPRQLHYGVFSGPECRSLSEGVLILSNQEAERLNTPAFQSWNHIAPFAPAVIVQTGMLAESPPLRENSDFASVMNPSPEDERVSFVNVRANDTREIYSAPNDDLINNLRINKLRALPLRRVLLACVSLIALLTITLLATNLLQSSSDIKQVRSQLSETQHALQDLQKQVDADKKVMKSQLSETQHALQDLQKQVDANKKVMLQTQMDLLNQATILKNDSPLDYRRLLRTIVKLDPQSDSGKNAAAQLGTPIVYMAIANDTLAQIAKNFNVSVAEIQKANPGVDLTVPIQPGQQLTIPGEMVAS
jgi:LysM repeat protein/proteasome lid subunit RPN8/RPN11